jgi:hypothetical protein
MAACICAFIRLLIHVNHISRLQPRLLISITPPVNVRQLVFVREVVPDFAAESFFERVAEPLS